MTENSYLEPLVRLNLRLMAEIRPELFEHRATHYVQHASQPRPFPPHFTTLVLCLFRNLTKVTGPPAIANFQKFPSF